MKWSMVAGILVFMLFLPTALGAGTLPWSEWHFSNPNYVSENGNEVVVNLSNATMVMNTTVDMKRGYRLSMPMRYSVSEYATIAGLRVFLNGEKLEERTLTGSGRLYVNVTSASSGICEIAIKLYVIQGRVSITMEEGKIIVPENGMDMGLYLSGIGISTVFLVLGLLSVIMYGMKPREMEKEKEEEKMHMSNELSNDEIIAIMAAIESYMNGKKFRVISVKESPWKYHGRMANMRRWK